MLILPFNFFLHFVSSALNKLEIKRDRTYWSHYIGSDKVPLNTKRGEEIRAHGRDWQARSETQTFRSTTV